MNDKLRLLVHPGTEDSIEYLHGGDEALVEIDRELQAGLER